jgi:N-acyl-D-amino-acid deacylase
VVPDEKAGNASRSGQTVQQIADAQGKHVVDALLDMVVEDDLATEFFAPTQGREAAQFTTEVLNSNLVVAGVSDGGAHVKFLTAGIYPTDLLIWLVRDEKTISLEDAHYKLSYLPAHLGGFKTVAPYASGRRPTSWSMTSKSWKFCPRKSPKTCPGGEWRRIQKSKATTGFCSTVKSPLKTANPREPCPAGSCGMAEADATATVLTVGQVLTLRT